jgi:O-antigen/teichoic acid export membrane protein
MRPHRRLAKNATANLVRGGVTALVVLLLPPILVRHMPSAAYSLWILVLQTAGYIAYLDFGLQTAVGRYVAYANERQDAQQRDAVFSTAFAGLALAGLVSLALLPIAVWAVPLVFPRVPPALISEMRWSLVIVGSSLAIGLPASAWSGVFVGLQRYEIPALTVGLTRALAAIGLVAVALAGKSIVVMSLVMAASNLLLYAAQYAFLRRLAPEIHFEPQQVSRSTALMLYGYCFGLTVMAFSVLLVTGFDLVLVARFDFGAVTAYSVAASLITFLSGLLYAVLNVIMPHAATLHAREDARGLGELMIAATRVSVVLLLLSGVPLLIYSAPILRVWIGSQFVETGRPILIVLVVANIVRLIGASYSIVLIAAGQQRYIKISPLSEGISNFAASLVLGYRFGAIGVALGTLLGSFVGLAAHLLYSMPRTHRAIDFDRDQYLLSGVVIPALWTTPLLLLAVLALTGSAIRPVVFGGAYILSVAVAGVALRRSGVALPESRRAAEANP